MSLPNQPPLGLGGPQMLLAGARVGTVPAGWYGACSACLHLPPWFGDDPHGCPGIWWNPLTEEMLFPCYSGSLSFFHIPSCTNLLVISEEDISFRTFFCTLWQAFSIILSLISYLAFLFLLWVLSITKMICHRKRVFVCLLFCFLPHISCLLQSLYLISARLPNNMFLLLHWPLHSDWCSEVLLWKRDYFLNQVR